MLHHKWLDRVPCAVQQDLIAYPLQMRQFASINPGSHSLPPPRQPRVCSPGVTTVLRCRLPPSSLPWVFYTVVVGSMDVINVRQNWGQNTSEVRLWASFCILSRDTQCPSPLPFSVTLKLTSGCRDCQPDLLFIYLFLNFFGCICGICKFLGQGLNPSRSCNLHHSCSNAGSLTHSGNSNLIYSW